MSSLKIPIIVGLIGFLLIFIINLVIGNALFVVVSRALIYGFLVSGIIFSITFVFKNYLGIDLEFNETNKESDNSNVDIVVGEENKKESEDEFAYVDYENKAGDNEGIDETVPFDEVKEGSAELNLEEGSKIESDNEALNGVSENEVVFSNDEENVLEDDNVEKNSDNDNIDRLGDLTYDSGRVENGHDISDQKPQITTDSIKQKIGIDVSFEDVAKAIRTKLKSDQ